MRNQLSWDIIKMFSGRNRNCFSYQEVMAEFPDKYRKYLCRLLSDMVENGLLCKVSRYIFHIVPLSVDPASYVPDGHQMAKYLMHNKEYYIGYYSAMQIRFLPAGSYRTGSGKKTNQVWFENKCRCRKY